jgi:hypothetical protein
MLVELRRRLLRNSHDEIDGINDPFSNIVDYGMRD